MQQPSRRLPRVDDATSSRITLQLQLQPQRQVDTGTVVNGRGPGQAAASLTAGLTDAGCGAAADKSLVLLCVHQVQL